MREKGLEEGLRIGEALLSLPHVVCIEEEHRGQLGFLKLWEDRRDQSYDTWVVVLEEAEVCVLPCELVREVGELRYLEEVFF